MKIKNMLAAGLILTITAAAVQLMVSEKSEAQTDTTQNKQLTGEDGTEGWSEASKQAVDAMKKKYGEPAGKTASMMIWENTDPWQRTIVYAEGYQHNFPMPHTDVLEQFIDYKVPVEKFTELAKYDGSVVCYHTNGEISARCDKEAANFLALNLANDVIKGNKDVKAARDFYSKTIMDMMNGGNPAYTQKLQFNVASGNTSDPDQKSPLMDKMKGAEKSTSTGN